MMKRGPLIPLLCLVVLVLTGCTPTTMVRPEDGLQEVADTYRVEPGIEWSRQHWRNLETWTVDGPQLQQLYFYEVRQTGDTLIAERFGQNVSARERERWPRFREGMTPHDVAELVTASLAQQGALDVRATNLRPARFGGRPGFHFDLHFLSPTNLDYRGLVTGHIDAEQRLYLVLYFGTEVHYYGEYLQAVESILTSLEIIEG